MTYFLFATPRSYNDRLIVEGFLVYEFIAGAEVDFTEKKTKEAAKIKIGLGWPVRDDKKEVKTWHSLYFTDIELDAKERRTLVNMPTKDSLPGFENEMYRLVAKRNGWEGTIVE